MQTLLLALCAVAIHAQTSPAKEPVPSGAIILRLNDVGGFSGGQDIAVDADGNVFVRTAGHDPQHTESRFWEARFHVRLSRAELSELVAFVKTSGIAQYRERRRSGVPDEARPHIVVAIPGQTPLDVGKWDNDKDPNFDTLYKRLLALVDRATKTEPYKRQPYGYQAPFP